MPLRIGVLSTAHMHVWSYAAAIADHPEAVISGVWDDDASRLKKFTNSLGISAFSDIREVLEVSDAVLIASENLKHAELIEAACEAGKPILCEKPLVASEEQAVIVTSALARSGAKLMTAFPCRYSPAFQKVQQRLSAGEIGAIKGICATNRGRCPFDWFVETPKSGGGCMIDHVVHVADLLRVLTGEEVATVQAQIGNNIYSQNWEDTAMLTLQFPSGIFATLDSSWSRPQNYKTWGDVTMNIVGEKGVIELDMFNQHLSTYKIGTDYSVAGYGSNIDRALVNGFISMLLDDSPSPITAHDGIQAARIAFAGYESARIGKPVQIH
jgi:predicted dehydrogenase